MQQPVACDLNHGEVCETMARSADGKFNTKVCTKAAHNVAEGEPCKLSGECVNGNLACITHAGSTVCRNANCSRCPQGQECSSKDKGILAGSTRSPSSSALRRSDA